jgi:hypothetical protein
MAVGVDEGEWESPITRISNRLLVAVPILVRNGGRVHAVAMGNTGAPWTISSRLRLTGWTCQTFPSFFLFPPCNTRPHPHIASSSSPSSARSHLLQPVLSLGRLLLVRRSSQRCHPAPLRVLDLPNCGVPGSAAQVLDRPSRTSLYRTPCAQWHLERVSSFGSDISSCACVFIPFPPPSEWIAPSHAFRSLDHDFLLPRTRIRPCIGPCPILLDGIAHKTPDAAPVVSSPSPSTRLRTRHSLWLVQTRRKRHSPPPASTPCPTDRFLCTDSLRSKPGLRTWHPPILRLAPPPFQNPKLRPTKRTSTGAPSNSTRVPRPPGI